MIRHIVMFRWKDSFTDEIRAQWIEGLEQLEGNIPGLLALVHGPDVLKTDKSWDHVIIADFTDLKALDVYNTHPLHEAIKPFSLPNVRDLAYVDLELDQSPALNEEPAEASETAMLAAGTASAAGKPPTHRPENPTSPLLGPSANTESTHFQERT